MHKMFNTCKDSIAFHHQIDSGRDYHSSPHRHENFYEIFYLIQGDVTFILENNRFTLPEDSLVLIPLNTTHTIISNSSNPVERYSVHFIPQLLPAEHRSDLLRPFHENKYGSNFYFAEVSQSRLPRCFDSLSDFDTLPEDILDLYSSIILESILIHILTFSRTANMISPAYSPTTQKVIDYLNLHLTEALSLDNIAAALYMNKDHLNREFKKNLGITIKDYIQYQRILLAQDIIRKKQITDTACLTEVALAAGFQSYSTFYRSYKRVLGYSPSEEIK